MTNSTKDFEAPWFLNAEPLFKHFLSRFSKEKNLNFIEIGSFEGRGSCWLLENILTDTSCTLTCIDTWKGGYEHNKEYMSTVEKRFIHNTKEYKDKLITIKNTSYNALSSIQHNIEYYDFIYIDGGHTMKDVLQDAVLSFPLIKKGGIIAFDDYQWELQQPVYLRPEQGINAFVAAYQTEVTVLHAGGQVWLEKK